MTQNKYAFIFVFVFLFLQGSAQALTLKKIVTGLESPVYLTYANEDSSRLFILEQDGQIKVFKNGKVQKKAFLNLEGKIASGGEKGLLGLAFHPNFKSNGKFYINYTLRNKGLKTRVSEFNKKKKERVLLEFAQPYPNHNGGMIAFGPDGYLYIGIGDGGWAGDPHQNGQNLSTLLGSIIRINVNSKQTYTIPKDNPFIKSKEARGEIWAYGIRNPWRFSFDRKTKKLWLADVGQSAWEEIDIVTKGGNYGWRFMEGKHCYRPRKNCKKKNFIDPVFAYTRSEGVSVTGGYVYRGKAVKSLYGKYIYADYGSGNIWALSVHPKRPITNTLLLKTKLTISSFGEDAQGELYVMDHQGGNVFKITP